MFRKLFIVLIIIISFTIYGCARYDVNIPDTVDNRNGFEDHLKIKPDETISQVYYYADELGSDVRYQLSFKCNKETIKKIISKLSLTSGDYSGLAPRDDLTWWKPDSTKERTHWVKKINDKYYKELWYSEKDRTAFYHEYSM